MAIDNKWPVRDGSKDLPNNAFELFTYWRNKRYAYLLIDLGAEHVVLKTWAGSTTQIDLPTFTDMVARKLLWPFTPNLDTHAD